MARAPYRGVELTEALRPVAAPVDTFVQAQVPSRDTNLQDLARSLSGLGGSLQSLVGQRDAKAEEEDRLRGEAAFHANNQQGYAEAVASGAIPAQASPEFIRAYKKAQGEVAGNLIEQKFSAAYDQFPDKGSTDPAVYDKFVSGFLKDNISTQDPDILRGLLPRIRQVTANWQQKHIGDVSRATMQGAIQTEAARNDQAIEAANSAGLGSKTGTDYPGVFGQIEANRAAALKRGLNKEKYDEQVVDGVTSSAIKLRDPKILDFLDRKVPGTDYTWANTPYGREAKQKTIDTLETMGRRSIAEDEKKRREEKQAEKDGVTRDTINAILKDPNAPLPEPLLARGEKVDPDFRINAIRWRDTIGKGTQTSDNGEMLRVTTEVLQGGGLDAVQKAMRNGVFKNPEDLTKTWKLAEAMTKEGPALDGIMKSASAKTILDTIKARTAGDKDASRWFDDGSLTDEGQQAQTDFRLQVLQWREENPRAGVIQQEKAIADIGAGILKRIQQPGGPNTAVTLDRAGNAEPNRFGAASPGDVQAAAPSAPATPAPPREVPRDEFGMPRLDGNPQQPVVPNPLAPPPAAPPPPAPPVQPQAPKPATPTAPAPAPSSPPRDAQGWYDGLPEEARRKLEAAAATQKKPLQMLRDEVYQRGLDTGRIPRPPSLGKQSALQAPDGTPIETASVQAGGGPAADIEQAFTQASQGAFSGRATFDGTKATLNGQTFTTAASADQVARRFEGFSENDPQQRQALTAFLSKAAGKEIDPQKIPWCAAFVDAVLDASGQPKRGSLLASDFLDYGTATEKPTKGDVVVFKSMARGSSGHVGFVVGIEGDRVRYIAGNDDNRVQEDTLPLAKVAGFRRPPGATAGVPVDQPQGRDTISHIQAAFERALGGSGSSSGNYNLAVIKNNPKAAHILDFVSGPESRGNYNAYFGHGGSTEDLSKRTLDQTIAWSQNRGTKSSATGRYQFMAATLQGLKKEMGLTGREAFTPLLQDQMAVRLLERRGFSRWQAGKMSDADFANNLALEWASLPNITAQNGRQAGQSAYAGDGLNKSLVTPQQVLASLSGAGALPGPALQQTADAAVSPKTGIMGMFQRLFRRRPTTSA